MPSWVRRSRTELILVKPDGAHVDLASDWSVPDGAATQDLFQVSPNGAFLAYVSSDELHVRAADGTERVVGDYTYQPQMRFSADGAYLAIVTGTDAQHLTVLELATGTLHELATFEHIEQIEWLKGGIVASIPDETRGKVLVEFAVTGTAKTIMEGHGLERFVTATDGTRVVVFRRDTSPAVTRVLSFDAATPGPLRELRTVEDPVTNAALSRDGKQLAFATALAVFTAAGDARPESLADSGNVHSLWFAADGRLGFASASALTIRNGDDAQRVTSDAPINMLRFDPTSGHALIATANDAKDAALQHTIATAPANGSVVGADRYAGGLVLWTNR